TTTTPGPVRRTQRALAPDLTRGAMLLFIALANAGNVAFASQPGFDMTPHGPGRVLNVLMAVLVDARAYPVFAVMFGYGLVQLSRRLQRDGQDDRRVLVRRNLALVGFGLAHATLLYFGDFLGAYGIVGLAATYLLLRRSDRFHRWAFGIWVAQLAYVGLFAVMAVVAMTHGGDAHPTNSPDPSLAATSYRASMVDRLHEWPLHTLTVLPVLLIVWLGIWAARRRLLEDPTQRPLLRRTAVVCLAVTVLGGLPYGLATAGWLHVDSAGLGAITRLHDVSGMYGGPGYVALLALVALRFGDRRPAALEAVACLGRRSMTGYLTQSVVWVLVLSPWALDLGGSAYVALLLAVVTWLGTVCWSVRMERRDDRGPAERALRRIAYGRAA
ncbi:MAG: putative rane protein, partial [Nocardioidaceae bacterium]|nr:putative rane protein [Nocardioidaceae bacterium]